MFHSTFPKLDIITDYILNYEAAARTSVTSQMMCGCDFTFYSGNLVFETYFAVEGYPIGLELNCLADRVIHCHSAVKETCIED